MKQSRQRNIATAIVALPLFVAVLLFLICIQGCIALFNRLIDVPQDWSNEYGRK